MTDESRDPLARRRVTVTGPHVPRIALAVAGALAIGLGGWWLTADEAGPEPERMPVPRLVPDGPGRLPDYADLAEAPPEPPPAPRLPAAEPAPAAPSEPRPREAARDTLRERAMDAGVGGWSRDRSAGMVAAAAASEAVPSTGLEEGRRTGACRVSAGTPIHAVVANRVVGEQRGTLLARVARDVWGDGFDCLAVPAGSTLTLDYAPAAARGQTRIEVASPRLVRPWPRADMVAIDAAGTDATGAAGLPGAVSVPWASTGLLIAASTAVELAGAALTGGGSLLGAILGREVESPLDRAARAALERAPVVTVEAGAPVVLLLRGALATDDFRTGG